ncbi:MAG TPA: putative quinol monooxygenase [Draconibacterium sp.]|nr:putative quinol monooxygenase [Draconibacterium sp.]
MISIVAKFIVQPGKEEEFLKLAKVLVVASNEEKGCIEYGLHKDVSKENTYCMLEKWKDQAAIDEHNSSPHFTTIVPKLGEMATVEVDIYQPV